MVTRTVCYSIKDKINAPPTDPDDQPVPRSLLRLFAFQQPRAPAEPPKKRPKRPHEGRWRRVPAVTAHN